MWVSSSTIPRACSAPAAMSISRRSMGYLGDCPTRGRVKPADRNHLFTISWQTDGRRFRAGVIDDALLPHTGGRRFHVPHPAPKQYASAAGFSMSRVHKRQVSIGFQLISHPPARPMNSSRSLAKSGISNLSAPRSTRMLVAIKSAKRFAWRASRAPRQSARPDAICDG